MADDLPTEYEDIILGTGLQESILAAALARIGRRVLHFDRNNYYSGEWASFHLQGILEWIDKYQTPAHESCGKDEANPSSASSSPETSSHPNIEDGLKLLPVSNEPSAVFNLTTARYARDEIKEEAEVKPQEEESPPSPDVNRREDESPSLADAGRQPEENQTNLHDDGSPTVRDLAADGSTEEEKTNDETAMDERDHLGVPGDPADLSPVVNSADEDTNSNTLGNEGSATGDLANSSPAVDGADGDLNSSTSVNDGSASGDLTDPPPAVNSAEGDLNSNTSVNDGSASGDLADPSPAVNSAEGDLNNSSPGDGAAAEATRRKIWTWQELSEQWRRFNIDLAPKLMFCRGAMVDILVQSRISRYAEFKAVSRLLTSIENKLEHVPCSRSDVFSSRYVSMLEKRMLMKLIEFVLHYQDRTDDYEGFKDKPFSEFLQKRKLTPTLQHFVIHSIAMVTASTPTEEALQAMQFFLKSLGRYGNTAFLWTLYGSGELPQCFCRMAAVFGGIYMLRTTANFLIVDSNNACQGMIDSEGRRLSCKNIIMDYSYTTSKIEVDGTSSFVSRAVLLTDRTLKESQHEEITFLTIPPPNPGEEPVRVLEIGSAACASPRGIFVVHLTRKCHRADAEKDLMPFIKNLFQDLEGELDHSDERPKLLWSMMFSYEDKTNLTVEELRRNQPEGVYVTGGPGCSVGYQHAVRQAKEIFELICPGEEFLPPAPNPEDIIYEEPTGDNPGHGNKAGFEDENQEDSQKALPSNQTESHNTSLEADRSVSGGKTEADQSVVSGTDQSIS